MEDEPAAAPSAPSAVAGPAVPQSRVQRLKASLRELPIVGPAFVMVYRLVKLPGRVALMVHQLGEIESSIARLNTRIDALAWQVNSLKATGEAATRGVETTLKSLTLRFRGVEDTIAGTQTNVAAVLGSIDESKTAALASIEDSKSIARTISSVLVALHEKTDRYQVDLRTQVAAVKPIFHAGDNLIISRVGDLIMAFPAEEWRLPVYQILGGQLEPGLYKRMKDTLADGMTVVDIGANVGTYTLLALQSVGVGGKVISYEPTPRVFDILKDNVQINGFLETGVVDLRRKAVSDGAADRASFYLSSNSLMNSLYGEDPASVRPVVVVDVECVSLDADLSHLERIDVIKIDAEGAEPGILRGMTALAARSPGITIFMEFAPQHLRRAGVDPSSFLREIRGQGFEILEVVEPSGDTRDVDDDALATCFSVNLMLTLESQR